MYFFFFCNALISLNLDCRCVFLVLFLPLCLVMLASLGLSEMLLASDMHLFKAPVWYLEFLHHTQGFYFSNSSFILSLIKTDNKEEF